MTEPVKLDLVDVVNMATRYASVQGGPGNWNKSFLEGLAMCGFELSTVRWDDAMMAPQPVPDEAYVYPYPSYIVPVRTNAPLL